MSTIASALGSLLLMIKSAVSWVAVALTVLVALGNELQHWRFLKRWIASRQASLRQAWGVSLGLYLVLAAAYGWVEQSLNAFLVDLLGIVVMVVVVWSLARRRAKLEPAETSDAPHRRRPPEDFEPAAHPDRGSADEDEGSGRRPRRRRRVPRY
jgi:hypothetical protein